MVADAEDSVAAAPKVVTTKDYGAAATEGAATSVDSFYTNNIYSAKGVYSCSLEVSTVTDSGDAGSTEGFDRVWGPCSVYVAANYDKDVTLDDAKGLANSIDSAVFDRVKGPCSAEDFSGALPPRSLRV